MNIKIVTVLGLVVLLLVPLGMIRGLVDERAQRRDETVAGIVDSFSREQLLAGPLIVVPWERTVRETGTAQSNGETLVVEKIESGRLHFLPERFAFDARLATEVRERGIYRALLYRTQGTLKGSFHVPADFGLGTEAARYRFGTPWLAIGVGDIRGIGNVPELRIEGRSLPFRPGTLTPPLREGIH
ncbi:MAG: inner membrane CreD family protein, partial [Planctomycetota bacterium]